MSFVCIVFANIYDTRLHALRACDRDRIEASAVKHFRPRKICVLLTRVINTLRGTCGRYMYTDVAARCSPETVLVSVPTCTYMYEHIQTNIRNIDRRRWREQVKGFMI